jgi:hypothetical protein
MQMLYDSEQYVVVHILANAPDEGCDLPPPAMRRDGFEIVDKKSGKGVYLDGSWAEAFQKQITAWQADTPTQEMVEECLEGYAQLAQNPVIVQ